MEPGGYQDSLSNENGIKVKVSRQLPKIVKLISSSPSSPIIIQDVQVKTHQTPGHKSTGSHKLQKILKTEGEDLDCISDNHNQFSQHNNNLMFQRTDEANSSVMAKRLNHGSNTFSSVVDEPNNHTRIQHSPMHNNTVGCDNIMNEFLMKRPINDKINEIDISHYGSLKIIEYESANPQHNLSQSSPSFMPDNTNEIQEIDILPDADNKERPKIMVIDQTQSTPGLQEMQYEVPKKIYQQVNGKFSRAHGLQFPFNIYQVTLIIWILINEAVFWLVQDPQTRFQSKPYALLIAAHCLFAFLMVYTGFLTTISDPTDPLIYYQRYNNDNKNLMEQLDQKFEYECTVCQMLIMNYSKHCGQCNRCCYKFDHHCKWLNNCIGQDNYRTFIYSTVSLILYCATSNIHLHLRISQDPLLWIDIAINYILIISLSVLLAYHTYFYYRGITTFTYLQFEQQRRQKKQELHSKTITEQDYNKWEAETERNLERFKYVSQKKTKRIKPLQITQEPRNDLKIQNIINYKKSDIEMQIDVLNSK